MNKNTSLTRSIKFLKQEWIRQLPESQIDDNLKHRELKLSPNKIKPRSSNNEENIEKSFFKVIDNNVYLSQDEEELTDLYLYTTGGTLVYNQEGYSGNHIINLTDYLNGYSHGNLFFVVGRKNGETKVKKLLW